jgi:hypothetical protein
MTTWKNCPAQTYFPDETSTYEVSIRGPEIVVSYKQEGRWMNYKGREVASGHYELACPENGGTATLHRSGDSEWLEGFWNEQGSEGMWRIQLSE